jgi:hypothetical protein
MIYTVQKNRQREMIKRHKIVSEIKKLNPDQTSGQGFKDWVKTEPTEEDIQKRNEQIEIVKKHHGNPARIIAGMVLQGFVFGSLIAYFSTVTTIPFESWMPVVAVILTLLGFVTKKTVILNFIFAVPVYYLSLRVGGSGNVFYLTFLVLKIVERIVVHLKNKAEMTKSKQ